MPRLFSATVFREMAKKGHSATFCEIARKIDLKGYCSSTATVAEAFEVAFTFLNAPGLRNDYVYRSAILRREMPAMLSGRATVLNEFRTGASRADLISLTGTEAVVWEIKSERDSLARLTAQIEDYFRVFKRVSILASASHLGKIQACMSSELGLFCLDEEMRIIPVRQAQSIDDYLSLSMMFETLRVVEIEATLSNFGCEIPVLPNTMRRSAYWELFKGLGDPADLHDSVVRVLMQMRRLPERMLWLLAEIPQSLHSLMLSVPISQSGQKQILEAVRMPLSVALDI